MSNMIALVGKSGSGKSHSISTLDPKETFLISISGKKLPMRGFDKYYTNFSNTNTTGNKINTSDAKTVEKALTYVNKSMTHIKNVVIDDAQYITTFELFERTSEKGWDKFSQVAANFFDVLKSSMDMREDLNVIIVFHDEIEKDDNLQTSTRIIKVGSKSIKEKIVPEGLFTYVFFTEVKIDEEGKKHYGFIVNNDGTTTAKSPVGCFKKEFIPNDLNYVIKHIVAYNNDEEIDLEPTEEGLE